MLFTFKLLLLGLCHCVIAIPLGDSIAQDPAYSMRISSPVYVKRHQELITYETTSKLIFKIELPKIEPPIDRHDTATTAYGLVTNTTNQIWKDYSGYIMRGNTTKRTKRQAILAGLAIGYGLHSIYSYFESQFGTDAQLEEYMNKLRVSMEENQREVLVFQHEVKEFSQKVTATLEKFSIELWQLDQTDRALLHLGQIQFLYFKIDQGISRCFNHLLPTALISRQLLKAKLFDLKGQLKSFGYEMSVEIESVDLYERIQLADCFVTDYNLYVMVNIPVRQKSWGIVELIPVPFRYQNETCTLKPAESQMLAVYGNSIRVLDQQTLRYCSFIGDHLCLVPQFSRPGGQTDTCMLDLYNVAGKTEVDASCRLQCNDRNDLLVNQVETTKVIITHPSRVVITCPMRYLNFTVPDHGSVEINILCNCSYEIDFVKFSGGLACVSNKLTDHVVHLIPAFMTLINQSRVYRENPPQFNAPVLNSIDMNNTVPPPLHISGLHHEIWLTVLTVLTIVSVGAAIFACYCFCRYK